MPSDVTCEQLREIGAELALGVLPGRERAGAIAHLDGCADCREYIAQLTLAGDRLIGLLPCGEPPVGFEARVAQALTRSALAQGAQGHGAWAQGATTPGRRRRARESGLPRPGRPGRRVRLRAAAVALAVALGFGGWAAGTAVENVTAGPSRPAAVSTGLLWAGLTSARGPGSPAGDIYAHPGSPGWVYLSVDLADAGMPYQGEASCLLVRHDGSTVRAGEVALHDGYGYWGGPVSVDPSALAGARLTASDGTVLATAHFAAAGRS